MSNLEGLIEIKHFYSLGSWENKLGFMRALLLIHLKVNVFDVINN